MMMKTTRLHFISLIAVLFALTISPAHLPVQAQETSVVEDTKQEKEQKRQIQLKIEEEQKKLKALEKKKTNVNTKMQKLSAERARLNKLLIDHAGRIQKSEETLTNLEARMEDLKHKEEIVRRSIKQRHTTIGEMLGLLQRMGRNPPPIMATHRDDALKMVRSAMLMSTMLPKLQKQANTFKAELDNLISLKTKIARQSERLRQQNAEMELDQQRVKELLDEKNKRLLSQNKVLQQFEARAKAHSKSVASLGDLITKIDIEMRRKTELGAYEQQLITDEKLAKKQLGKKAAVELSPSEKKNLAFINPGRIEPARPFKSVKRTLSLPARGKILRNFGDKMKYGNISKGLSIQTRVNAQITSPSDGWIVYAGKFRSYGQILIINAGGGYHILLAGLDRIDVKSSQFVLAGEPIGAMVPKPEKDKSKKGAEKPVLYVEFRYKGRPINPSPWWAEEQLAGDF